MKKIIVSFLIFAGSIFAPHPVRPMFRYQVYPRPVVVQRPYAPVWPYVVGPVVGGVVGYEIAKHQNHVIECKDFPFVTTSNGVEEIVHVKQCRVDNGPWQTPVEK